MAKSTKVVFTKTTIKQLVTLAEPKKTLDVVYKFSKGRTFKERKPYS